MAASLIQHLETLYRRMCESGAVLAEFQLGPSEKLRLVRRSEKNAASAAQTARAPSGSSIPFPAADIPAALRVAAPLSGVFYRAPAPSAPPFVEEGSSVKKGEVLCIIEAMKVLNEIKAPRDGKISSILALNGKHVKKGDLLFVYAQHS